MQRKYAVRERGARTASWVLSFEIAGLSLIYFVPVLDRSFFIEMKFVPQVFEKFVLFVGTYSCPGNKTNNARGKQGKEQCGATRKTTTDCPYGGNANDKRDDYPTAQMVSARITFRYRRRELNSIADLGPLKFVIIHRFFNNATLKPKKQNIL